MTCRCSTIPEEICNLGEGSCSQNDHCGEDDDGNCDLNLDGDGQGGLGKADGLVEILVCFRRSSSVQPKVQRHGEKLRNISNKNQKEGLGQNIDKCGDQRWSENLCLL